MDKYKQFSDVEVSIPKTDYVFYPMIVIGRGQYGTVYKGYNRKTNELVAIKHVISESEELEENLEREIALLQNKELQSSNNIIRCLDIINYQKNYYLVTELCDSSLNEYIQKTQLTEDESLSILYKIVQGYKVMKKKGVIHRDLKPANILMKNSIPKIADFGSARVKSMIHTEDVGTLPFKAPEILAGLNDYDEMVDIWSLGVTLYYMIFKDYPFKTQCLSQLSLLQEIYTKRHNELFKNGPKIRFETKDLICQMLEIEKEKRIKWIQIDEHPAFTSLSTICIEKQKFKDDARPNNSKLNNPSVLEFPVPNSNYLFYPFIALGRGQYGTVYKGSNKRKDIDLVIKHFIVDSESPADILKQLNVLKDPELQNHPNLVKYYDIINKDNNYYIIAEFCEFSLYQYIKKRHSSENEAISILYQIIGGYLALRKKNIESCNIKSTNIVIKNKAVKIADFVIMKGKVDNDIASLSYKAPEILEELNSENEVSDMWSLGVLIYYILFRDFPYKPSQGISKENLLAEIEKDENIIVKKKDLRISVTTQNLLLKMLQKNKEQRMKWDDILDDFAFMKIKNSEILSSAIISSEETKIDSLSRNALLESKIHSESARNKFTSKSSYSFSDPCKKSSFLIDEEDLKNNEQRNSSQVPIENRIIISPSKTSDMVSHLDLLSKSNYLNINDSGIITIDMTKKNMENTLNSPNHPRNRTKNFTSDSYTDIKDKNSATKYQKGRDQ